MVGGLFFADRCQETIYQSRIAAVVPSLNEAVREYSDLQAEILQHVHSEKYVYTNAECKRCRGAGVVVSEGVQNECPQCKGVGSALGVTPYGIHIIAAGKAGEMAIPAPPIGYINKSTEIARLQSERVAQHIYNALSTINMEFLAQTPLNQSGAAKEVDKDELNNLVSAVAEDIVKIMDRVYYFICEYRYSLLVPDAQARRAMLPSIFVPERFDLLNTSHILAEIASAKTTGVNPVLVRQMEIDYARKKFNASPETADLLQTIYSLDPLAGTGEDEKMSRLANKGILESDYVISCNIEQFIKRAQRGDADFFRKTYQEQKEVLLKYADEIKTANSIRQQIEPNIPQ